jgi:hypothetical protein
MKISDIKRHKFFEGFDFEGVFYKKNVAPFIPDSVFITNVESY